MHAKGLEQCLAHGEHFRVLALLLLLLLKNQDLSLSAPGFQPQTLCRCAPHAAPPGRVMLSTAPLVTW